MSKGTEVVLQGRRENLPAPVSSIAEIEQIGKMFETSGMFGCTQQGQGTVLAMTCVMQKMTPLEFIQTYHIVEGRPSMRADAMLAKLLEAGGTYTIIERTAEKASVKIKYRDAEGTFTMTHEDAKAEPFYWKKDGKTPKDNYASPRKRMQMLWARVTSDGVRTVAPIVVAGLYTPEEISDFGNEMQLTPAKTVAPVIEATKPADQPKPEVVEPGVLKPEEQVDFKVCPLGMKGQPAGTPFNDFDNATLQKFLKVKGVPEILDGHKQYVKALLEVREKGEEQK